MATLHVVAGKAGAGKTTLAREIARTTPALMICEDAWIVSLGDPVTDLRTFLAASAKVRAIAAPLCVDLLKLGTSVVLDFAGNTVNGRRWVRSIFEQAGADHELHFIRATDEVCHARVAERNRTRTPGIFFGTVTAQQVDEVNAYVTEPDPAEGFHLVVHDARS